MALKLVTPADANAPLVTTVEAKAHLRVTHSADDALIAALVAAATAEAESRTGRALLPQTWLLTLDAFPPELDGIALARVPVASVSWVRYDDTANAEQTLPSNQYSLDTSADVGPHRVRLVNPTASWPSVYAKPGSVRVQFVAGWPDAASVPASIKAWVKLMVGSMYSQRETIVTGTIVAELGFADGLLDAWRTHWV